MSEEQKPVCGNEPTEEQLNKQIAELQARVKAMKKELTPEEKAKREKEIKFFRELQRGAYFIKFIMDDLQKHNFNRHAKRRLIKEMCNKQFSTELIDTYVVKVDEICAYLDEILTPKVVDGAKFYQDLKDKEQKGELK